MKKHDQVKDLNAVYEYLYKSFDWFNEQLFDGDLPPVVFTIGANKARRAGHYRHDSFTFNDSRSENEIALNAGYFNRSEKEVLSTLVHEMAHHWKRCFGKRAQSGGYHCKEWGSKMESVGLVPSHTGEPGGKRTGFRMSHFILENGPFNHAADEWIRKTGGGFNMVRVHSIRRDQQSRNKVAYVCEDCRSKVWGKPGLNILCGDCVVSMNAKEN